MDRSWGGVRNGAGRLPQVFHLSKEAARSLALITWQRRTWQPDITELEVLEQLIDTAWREIDEMYQEHTEASGELE